MHYEINVSKEGRHFFGTHERSLPTVESLRRVLLAIRTKFPTEEGYQISVSQHENVSRHIIDPEF